MAKIEKRIDLPGSERTLLPGSRKIGPCEPQEQIRVTVFLRRGSSPKQFPDVEKIGKQPPAQRSHLSRAQFASRHGARPADIKKIRAFAAQNGLKVVEVSRPRRSVLLSGSIAAFSRAFGVERMEELLASKLRSAEEIVRDLDDALTKFVKGRPLEDDVVLLCIECAGERRSMVSATSPSWRPEESK